MSVVVRRVAGQQELDAALELRHRVFCVEQGVPKREEIDGRDGEALHLVAVRAEDGAVLGTCRLLLVDRTLQFSRLAVDASVRRSGLASQLLAEAELEARAQGARRIVLHAQTYAEQLYVAAGYEKRGHVFVEAGIEHVSMEKRLV
jgi:predicted GNAT family N-acyltransferase